MTTPTLKGMSPPQNIEHSMFLSELHQKHERLATRKKSLVCMAPGTIPSTDFLLAPIPTKRAKQKYIPESDEEQHTSTTKDIGALVETDNEEERSRA
jgi:hypothetical protein